MALEAVEQVKAQLKDTSSLKAVTRAHDISRAVLDLITEQKRAAA